MNTPKEQEQSAEERIGSMIGKIFVLALIAFFAWGYGSTLAAKLGLFWLLRPDYSPQRLLQLGEIRRDPSRLSMQWHNTALRYTQVKERWNAAAQPHLLHVNNKASLLTHS